MKSQFRTVSIAGILFLTSINSLSAQPQPGVGPVRAPSFSPYLNLVNRGNNPAINYFGIIRPGQQLQQQTRLLQQQLNQTNQNLSSGLGGINNTLITGRGATFGYYSHYYNNSPASVGGLTGGGGSRIGSAGASFGSGFAGGGGAVTALNRGGAVQSPMGRVQAFGGRR